MRIMMEMIIIRISIGMIFNSGFWHIRFSGPKVIWKDTHHFTSGDIACDAASSGAETGSSPTGLASASDDFSWDQDEISAQVVKLFNDILYDVFLIFPIWSVQIASSLLPTFLSPDFVKNSATHSPATSTGAYPSRLPQSHELGT